MATPEEWINGELRSQKIAATTVTWTLDAAQFLKGSVNSPPFRVDEVSFRFCIRISRDSEYPSEDPDIDLYVEASDYCRSYTLRHSLETIDGSQYHFEEYEESVDFSDIQEECILTDPCEQWHRLIGDSRVVRLVVTFIPEHSCYSKRKNVRNCEDKFYSSVDKMCRGELHEMTQPGTEAVWTVRFPSEGDGRQSALFDLGGDSFRFETFDSDAHFSIHLKRVGGDKRQSLASFKLTVHGSDETSPLSVFVSRLQFRANARHDFIKMKRNLLLSCLGGDNNGNVDLTIVCSIIHENECTRSVGLSVHGREGLDKALRDYNELFQTGKDTDVTVEVEGEKFHVHKAILGIRCSFFANMLKHDMIEKNTGVVKIPDYTADEFKDFLLYLYTARVESYTHEKALLLYRAADQYDVPDLKADSLEFLKRNLSVDTLADVITLSVTYQEKELLNISMQFFDKNWPTVYKTDSWKSIGKEIVKEANELYNESRAWKSRT